MVKRTIFALAVAGVAYVGALQAQENATLTLRSGERVLATRHYPTSVSAARAEFVHWSSNIRDLQRRYAT